ncbi:MAG: hypothetical protein Q8T08_11290, partial [Ignavibacteria bacterium]|nr:hypothetical protein [Ignavibacteria bacterium]
IEKDGFCFEIPGLSADDTAYGWIEKTPVTMHIKPSKVEVYRVIDIVPDTIQPKVMKIICVLAK